MGCSTLARMRERGDLTPVVMLTAHGSIPDAVSAMRLGAIDFLTKPITPAELRAVVAEVIERNDARTAPALLEPSAAPSALLRIRAGTGEAAPSIAASSPTPNVCSGRSSMVLRHRRKPLNCSTGCSRSRNVRRKGRFPCSASGSPAVRCPVGHEKDTAMLSIGTLALGLALFGLFYALVVGCDHL